MAVQNPYLTTDGDINQAKRRRAGDVPSIGDLAQSAYDPNPAIRNAQARDDAAQQRNAENGLPAPTGPNPARAARMQAQFNQPVTVGVPVAAGQPAARPAPDSAGLNRMVGGALSIAPAAIWEGAKNLVTDVANVGRSIIDAEQVPRPGYPRTSQLSQEIAEGASAFAGANRNLAEAAKESAREVTGSAPVAKPVSPMLQRDAVDQTAKPATAPAPSQQQAAAPSQAAQQPGQQAPAKPADSPYFATDSGIAVRRNENGVPEFTNDPQALANAQAMPAGGIGGQTLRTPGVSNMADDVALERRGSISNLGNGIGTFSQMNPGDSALALGRFERANQEREKMIQASRRGQIGEGGGRVTIVRDSSRAPSNREILALRAANQQESIGLARDLARQKSQQSILAGMDERLTNQLNRQRTQQELDIGGIQLAERQRLDGLAAQMADTSLSQDQREAARSAYASLSTPAKDRYILQDTVIASDPLTGPKYGKVAIDVLTGRPVAGGIGDGSLGLPAGVSKEQALSQAKAAIASGAPKDAVNRRLQDMGLDPI